MGSSRWPLKEEGRNSTVCSYIYIYISIYLSIFRYIVSDIGKHGVLVKKRTIQVIHTLIKFNKPNSFASFFFFQTKEDPDQVSVHFWSV